MIVVTTMNNQIAQWEELATSWRAVLKSYIVGREPGKAWSRHGAAVGLERDEFFNWIRWMRTGEVADAGRVVKSATVNEMTVQLDQIRTLDQLLDAAGVEADEWSVKSYDVSKWDQGDRQMFSVKAKLDKRPEWAAGGVSAVAAKPIPHVSDINNVAATTALIIPDSQNGYLRSEYGKLTPLHDRKAWDVCVAMAKATKPETIIMLGDMLDLAPWSLKYPRDPSLRYTTKPSLAELHWWIAQLRLASPGSRIVYIEGNHERRIYKGMVERLDEAVGLTVAGRDEDPIFSIPRLLDLDSLDVEYVGPYGAEMWLWNKVRVHHGDKAKAGGGSTVASILKGATHSEIVGHVHRLEVAQKTLPAPGGGHEIITAMTPGCITRIDGVVPSASNRVDWQQGFGFVSLVDGQVHMQTVPIINGTSVFGPFTFDGEDRVEQISADTGIDFS
jgi:hypothetical protein